MATPNRTLPFGERLDRRTLLERLSLGIGMLGLSSLLAPASAAPPRHFAPRARRVIFLFMNGGPSHLDTFDPKPALIQYAGQQPSGKLYKRSKGSGFIPSPLRFARHGQSGIEVSESLPHIAGVIDDCCVVRSMRTDIPNHEPALLQMHSGHTQPTRPSLGAWAVYGLGTDNENLPGYVVLRPSPKIVVGPALWSSAFLPAEHQAASVLTNDMRVDRLVRNLDNPRFDQRAQHAQLDLLARLNRGHAKARAPDPQLNAQVRAMETAFAMQAQASEAFDIEREPESVRNLYGDSRFARSCLLARRLVERGVRFVTVYYTDDGNNQPWDTHQNHDSGHKTLCADADRPTAALIRDLKLRGLLEDTLVIWSGEFGRTPYAENRDKGKPGRDHHHTAFSLLLAGGGVRGGTTHGASDELGMRAVDQPVHVHDLHATILHLLGLDHEKLTYRYSGRDFRLTDVHGRVVNEIIA
ncbi:MAG TPA: DUF1501 domain-containing protein [Verrucomicrobiales bacterium]|nr:DUF1501 domain-containing protein [Verrucomicrobiales bacterium]